MKVNGEDDVLSAERKAQMTLPASDVSQPYGFGWFLDPGKGLFVMCSNSTPLRITWAE